MRRRNFLTQTAYASFAVLTCGLAACKDKTSQTDQKPVTGAAKNELFKISLAQWSFNKSIRSGQMNPFDFSEKARTLGFEGIEFVNQLYFPYLETFSSRLAGINVMVKETNTRSEAAGVQNLLMMVDREGDLCVEDEKTRSVAIENHKHWIDAAHGLGCRTLRLNLFGSDDPVIWKETALKSLSDLCDYAQPLGLNVVAENHGGLSSNAALLAETIKEVNKPNCGILPDFDNFCLAWDSGVTFEGTCIKRYDRYQGMKEMMPYAKSVGAKAFTFDENGNEPTIDFNKMFSIIKDAGFSGWVGLEYEGDDLSEEAGILKTKALIEKTIKNLS